MENQFNPKHTAAGEAKLDGSQWGNCRSAIEAHMYAKFCRNWVWQNEPLKHPFMWHETALNDDGEW